MTGEDIAAEMAAALREAGAEVGNGAPLIAVLTRQAPEDEGEEAHAGTPWGDAATGSSAAPQTYSLAVLDDGIKTRYRKDDAGALIPRTARVVLAEATGEKPAMGDTITLADGAHEIVAVMPVAPGGVALLFEIELAI